MLHVLAAVNSGTTYQVPGIAVAVQGSAVAAARAV